MSLAPILGYRDRGQEIENFVCTRNQSDRRTQPSKRPISLTWTRFYGLTDSVLTRFLQSQTRAASTALLFMTLPKTIAPPPPVVKRSSGYIAPFTYSADKGRILLGKPWIFLFRFTNNKIRRISVHKRRHFKT